MSLKPHLFVSDKPLFIGGMAGFKYTDKLYHKFWAADKYTEEPFNISRQKGDLLLVPRELATNSHYGKDLRVWGPKVQFAINCTAPARNPEQQRVYDESLVLLQQGRSHIIKASTGFGKTWLGARLARALGHKTLVVVTKEDLLSEKQWLGAIKKFAGVPADEIGLIRQNKCDVKGKTVVFGMVQSLAKEKYPEWIYDEFGLVIFDEVHHMSADTFQIVAGLFNSKLRLGLSAGASAKNQMRSDGKDFVFEAHIGPVAVHAQQIAVPPKILVLETPWKVPQGPRRVNGAWKMGPMMHEPGRLGKVLTSIAQCGPRNELIVKLVLKAYKKGRYTVVFSDLARDKHLNTLYQLAVLAGIPESDMGFYVGTMKEKEREVSKTRKVVWATYGMTAEATDVPIWDTCVLATPRSNVKQAIGRILRELEGKPRPVVFDLVDYDSRVLRNYFKARCELYHTKEIGGEVVLTHT